LIIFSKYLLSFFIKHAPYHKHIAKSLLSIN
jgi:hypothetical protein